jgi:hypothetical protein
MVSGPRSTSARATKLAVLVAVAFIVSSCGGSGSGQPSRSPSLSRETSRTLAPPSATSTAAAAPTETSAPTATSRPTVTRTPTANPTPTLTETERATATTTATVTLPPTVIAAPTVTAAPTPQPATPTPTPTAAQTEAVTPTSSDTSSTPAWLWWLIGAIVLAVAVVSTFLIRRNNRKQAWADRLSSSEADVAWFARELIPHLSQAPSVQQVAGGWRISSDRVIAAEDRMTSLEAAAIDDVGRGQARTLRDAVREARTRLDALAVVGDMATALSQLQGAAGELEAALALVSPATQGATRGNPPQR